ncbi:MAG: helix-turn-helix domain-containing protein [Planctomycetaceae bacterium]
MSRRSRTRGGLPEWLSQTELPVFVVDSRRVVLFFNRGCERLTGWTAGDLIGKVCEVHSDGAADRLTTLLSALCPPVPPVPTSNRIHVLTQEGESLDRVAHFFPLPPVEPEPDESHPLRWLGIIGQRSATVSVAPVSAESELHAELSTLKSDLRKRYSFDHVIATESSMRRLLARLQLAVNQLTTIAFYGQAGTGREHLARAVHYASENRIRAFVPVDCRLPVEALSEILDRLSTPDKIDLPIPVLRVGAVLLQHVESLPRELQLSLIENVDLTPGPHAIRWMMSAASSFDGLVDTGVMLPDFRDKFGVLEVALPSLRERPADLAFLAQHALEECNSGSQKQLTGFSPDVWREFQAYNWPGQLDELFAVVREAHATSAGPIVSIPDLPFRFRAGKEAQNVGPPLPNLQISLDELLTKVEKEHLLSALERSRGSKQLAADFLGIPRAKLYRRMEAHGLWKPNDPPETAP